MQGTWIIFLLLICGFTFAEQACPYDVHLSHIPGKQPGVMIAAHGSGDNYQIAESVQTDKKVVTFNPSSL